MKTLKAGRRTEEEKSRPKCEGKFDPFTRSEIDPSRAIRIYQKGKYWCFDAVELYDWIVMQHNSYNPFNNETFTVGQFEKIKKKLDKIFMTPNPSFADEKLELKHIMKNIAQIVISEGEGGYFGDVDQNVRTFLLTSTNGMIKDPFQYYYDFFLELYEEKYGYQTPKSRAHFEKILQHISQYGKQYNREAMTVGLDEGFFVPKKIKFVTVHVPGGKITPTTFI